MKARKPKRETISRFDGKDLVVTRGRVDFRLRRGSVTCTTCDRELATDDPERIRAFYAEHEHDPPPADAAPPPPAATVELIVADLRELAGDELEVVRLVVAGLRAGRQVYGQLDVDSDHRDHELEAMQEARDMVTYDAAALLRRVRRSARPA